MIKWEQGEELLGEYLIEKELGKGGMGRVWLVKSNSTERRFAVKQTILKNDKSRKAFLAELQTWIDLPEHSNIVPCRFFRTVGDEIVIFADYIEGESLRKWINQSKLTTLEQILNVAIQFAWGLNAIHVRGLVHQDVKPENVLMTAKGVPMVADFGLVRARQLTHHSMNHFQGNPAGMDKQLVSYAGKTPEYASPEQVARKQLSHKTDIWSWGVSVLDMFMGRISCPEGGQIAAVRLEGFWEYGGQEECLPKMPEGVANILRKCFARDPIERWTSMEAVSKELVEMYQLGTGRPFPEIVPYSSSDNAPALLLRNNYNDAEWNDPAVFGETVIKILEAREIRWSPPSRGQHQHRAGFAMSDLNEYQEMVGQLLSLPRPIERDTHYCIFNLLYNMALILEELNDVNGAITAYDQCREHIRDIINGGYSANMLLYDDARVIEQKALLLRRTGQLSTSLGLYDQALQIWSSIIQQEKGSELNTNYALLLSNTAIAYRHAGKAAKAIELYDKAIPIYETLSRQEASKASDKHMGWQSTLRLKGIALRKSGNIQGAYECYDKARQILAEMKGLRSDRKYMLASARLLEVMAVVVPPSQKEDLLGQVVQIYEKIIFEYSDTNLYPEYASSLLDHADAMKNTGAAIKECQRSVAAWRNVIDNMGLTKHKNKLYYATMYQIMLYADNGNYDNAAKELINLQGYSGLTVDELEQLFDTLKRNGGVDAFS